MRDNNRSIKMYAHVDRLLNCAQTRNVSEWNVTRVFPRVSYRD